MPMYVSRKHGHSNYRTVVINEEYLAKSDSILTPEEYRYFSLEPYCVYQKDFFAYKIKEFYETFKNTPWFKWRYCMENEFENLINSEKQNRSSTYVDQNINPPTNIDSTRDSEKSSEPSTQVGNIVFSYENLPNNIRARFSQVLSVKKQYVSKRLREFLTLHQNIEKAVNFKSKNINYDIFPNNKKHILIRNIENRSLSDVLNFATLCPEIQKINFALQKSQKNRDKSDHWYKDDFRVFTIITLNPNADLYHAAGILNDSNSHYDCEPLTTMQIHVKEDIIESNEKDLEYSTRILQILCEKYGVDVDISEKNETFVILLLRYVFCYCYLCCRQFDSVAEMSIACGDYHIFSTDRDSLNTHDLISDVQPHIEGSKKETFLDQTKNTNRPNSSFEEKLEFQINTNNAQNNSQNADAKQARNIFNRKNEIITLVKSFEQFKHTDLADFVFEKAFTKIDENFACLADGCDKSFASKETAVVHLRKKHTENLPDMSKDFYEYQSFIENIDMFFLFHIQKLGSKFLPNILKNMKDDNQDRSDVVYDLDHIYSGDLNSIL